MGGPGLCSTESKHHAWGVKANGRQLAQLAGDQSGGDLVSLIYLEEETEALNEKEGHIASQDLL